MTGLTSAATIWVVAGIGLLIGAGLPGLGLVATLLALVTLEALRRLEPKILGRCRYAFADDGRVRPHLTYCETHPAHHRFVAEVLEVPGLVAGGR